MGCPYEADILAERVGKYPRRTFREALERYANEISVKKEGEDHERKRIAAFIQNFPDLVNKQFAEVKPNDIAKWRDTRLSEVSSGSVRREANLFSNVFTIGKKEWRWCGESPFADIEKPRDNPSRKRRVSPWEIKRICRQLGYVTGRIETKTQEVALAFLISLRTGMRAGEVLRIDDKTADLVSRVITVKHKTQYLTGEERKIPITAKTVRLIDYLKARGKYFTVSNASRSALFRKARIAQGIDNLRFHDARAEGITRFSRKVDVLTLAKISGHKDLKILLNTYYRETPEDIAKRLT